MVKKRAVFLLLCLAAGVLLFPILLLALNSFMGEEELLSSYGAALYDTKTELQWKLFPMYPTLKAYVELLLDSPDFFVMFWNSCKQVFPILAGQTIVGLPAAWAFGRFSFKGKRSLFYLYMVLMILPFQVTMVSSYGVLSSLKLLDTGWAIILPGVFSAFPVFLMTKFFQGIPDSLLEAARVDGAGEFLTFVYVGLPLGFPGITASLLLNFLEFWNAIEPPMTFLKTESKFPVSLYLSSISLEEAGTAFAASVIIMAPAVFLFAWGQSYLEQGIIASGLKE